MPPRIGLCASCRHCRVVESRRGSRFFLCRKSEEVAGWPRYPGLPVLECRFFEAGAPEEPGDRPE